MCVCICVCVCICIYIYTYIYIDIYHALPAEGQLSSKDSLLPPPVEDAPL